MQNNISEKKPFDIIILVIDNHRSIRPLISIKSIFLELNGLSLIVGRLTNLNHTKNESYSDNYNMDRENNEISQTEKMPPIKLNCIESKSHDSIYSKNYRNIRDRIGIQQPLSDDLKGPINNFNISRVGDEVTWIGKMPQINPDYTKSKNYSDNYDSNDNSNLIGNEE